MLGQLFQRIPNEVLGLKTCSECSGLEHKVFPFSTIGKLRRVGRNIFSSYPLLVANLIKRALQLRPVIHPGNFDRNILTHVRQKSFKRVRCFSLFEHSVHPYVLGTVVTKNNNITLSPFPQCFLARTNQQKSDLAAYQSEFWFALELAPLSSKIVFTRMHMTFSSHTR